MSSLSLNFPEVERRTNRPSPFGLMRVRALLVVFLDLLRLVDARLRLLLLLLDALLIAISSLVVWLKLLMNPLEDPRASISCS